MAPGRAAARLAGAVLGISLPSQRKTGQLRRPLPPTQEQSETTTPPIDAMKLGSLDANSFELWRAGIKTSARRLAGAASAPAPLQPYCHYKRRTSSLLVFNAKTVAAKIKPKHCNNESLASVVAEKKRCWCMANFQPFVFLYFPDIGFSFPKVSGSEFVNNVVPTNPPQEVYYP